MPTHRPLRLDAVGNVFPWILDVKKHIVESREQAVALHEFDHVVQLKECDAPKSQIKAAARTTVLCHDPIKSRRFHMMVDMTGAYEENVEVLFLHDLEIRDEGMGARNQPANQCDRSHGGKEH